MRVNRFLLHGLAMVGSFAGAACTRNGLLLVEVRQGAGVPSFDSIDLRAGQHRRSYPTSEKKLGLYLPPGSYAPDLVAYDANRRPVASGSYPGVLDIQSGDIKIIDISLVAGVMPPPDGGDATVDRGPASPLDGGPTSGVGGHADAGSDGDMRDASQEQPAPPGCAADAATTGLVTVFSDGFESCPTTSVGDCPGWTRANAARESSVSTTWVYAGSRNILLSSFTTSTELVYARLPVERLPARVTVQLVYTPDGFGMTPQGLRDFGEVGLARVSPSSRFDVTPVLALRGQDHRLLFAVAPGSPVAGAVWPGSVVFEELEYARVTSGDLPAHNHLRLELDFCSHTASVYAGTDQNPPLRGTFPIGSGDGFNALYLTGGTNPTYYDDISVAFDAP